MQLKSLSIRCGDFLHVSRTYPYVADVAGIGYVFHAEDPYTGIDLDSCYDHSSRVLAPWAQQLVTLLNSYTDISPTGTGVKLWVDASKPGTACEHWNMELYDRKRFFTVTGERLQGTPKRIERRQPETELVYTVMTLVFGTMFSAKNGAQIRQLWYGDWEGAGYPSSFEVDMALASYIAFYVGPDPERIANLCLLSGLAYQDKKWAQEDYRRRTIEKVLEGKSEFYTPPRSHTSSPCNETGDEPMPSPDQETPLAFPLEALPPVLRRFVENAVAALPCPPDYVALPALAACATAIGTSRVVEIQPGWQLFATFYFAIVGPSGSKKSPAQARGVAWVVDKQRELSAAYKVSEEAYQQQMKDYEARLEDWKQARKKNKGAAGERPVLPDAPVYGHVMTSDATVEALVRILSTK